jgi:hypothetical protein
MVWAGQFVLSKAGAWNLRVGNLDRARSLDPRCYSPLPLTVASAGRAGQAALGRSSLGPTLLLAVAVLAVLVGTTLFVVIRTRARPPGPS